MLQDARCTIRAEDVPAVVEAYNAGITERIATFETRPWTVADVSTWLQDGQPFVVADRDGRVLWWARAGPYPDCCVYQASASTLSTCTPTAAAGASAANSSPSCAPNPNAAARWLVNPRLEVWLPSLRRTTKRQRIPSRVA
jgi:hypothetical protein